MTDRLAMVTEMPEKPNRKGWILLSFGSNWPVIQAGLLWFATQKRLSTLIRRRAHSPNSGFEFKS